jgi:ABC-type uncharacterized transport system substrate-binding protein
MKRRAFITLLGGAAAWPLAARAQQGERMQRVSLLLGIAENHPEAQSRVKAFQKGLRDLGWVEGRNIRIDYRFAASDPTRIREYAAELVRLMPDVIVGNTTPVLTALRRATSTIPIVFAVVKPGRTRLHFELGASGRQCYWFQLYRVRNGREMVDDAQRRGTQSFSGQIDVQPRGGSVL